MNREGSNVKVGFTGTRSGMTEAQDNRVCELIHEFWAEECHHGDCVGADKQFNDSAWLLRRLSQSDEMFKSRRLAGCIVIHPPVDKKLRAYCAGHHTRPAQNYLARNRAIVDETDVLIAAPVSKIEPQSRRGQGTWSTIEHARKRGKRILIVFPDGETEEIKGTLEPSETKG